MTSMQTEAAARWLHDYLCDDGDVTDCARWKAGSDPANRFHHHHQGHVEYYTELARGALEAAGI